jgi:16S rRNA (uracil1498-N3)-methyltransferase
LSTPRIYHPGEMDIGRPVELGENHLRYIRNVLRLRKGDPLILFSGKGVEYGAVVRDVTRDAVTVDIMDRKDTRDNGIRITLAQALPKGPKMDFIVQKAAELGVSRVIPFDSSRSIPKLTADKARSRTARWQKIALEACRQCGRGDIPEVTEVHAFHEVLEMPGKDDLKLIFWEEESGLGIKNVLRNKAAQSAGDFFVIVGPEGGFSKDEVGTALQKDCLSVSLGRRVLKVETASIAILAILQYERGSLAGTAESERTG